MTTLKMEKREKITLIFWLALCLFFAVESFRMGIGQFNEPGPGFLAFWVSLFVFIMAIVAFLKERGAKILREAKPIFHGKHARNIVYSLAALFAYPFFLDKLGFFLCTLLFTGFCLKMIGLRKWTVTVITAISVGIVAYLLFVVWLGVQLPRATWVHRYLH
jgi:hypothetical protein